MGRQEALEAVEMAPHIAGNEQEKHSAARPRAATKYKKHKMEKQAHQEQEHRRLVCMAAQTRLLLELLDHFLQTLQLVVTRPH